MVSNVKSLLLVCLFERKIQIMLLKQTFGYSSGVVREPIFGMLFKLLKRCKKSLKFATDYDDRCMICCEEVSERCFLCSNQFTLVKLDFCSLEHLKIVFKLTLFGLK